MSEPAVAHKINEKKRTNDVLISDNIDFSGLLLSDAVLKGLQNSGFERPSPIQLKAIPLGRCGLDLIVQAKSGTGKTCVFSVIALEGLQIASQALQVLVLAPTREIAIQIWEVIRGIGRNIPNLSCQTFIGGLPLLEDRQKLQKCHIAVGTPGRIKQLIETGMMSTDSIRMFVLDEADKLLEEGFQEQINWIYSSLPENKQMLALSATYPEYLAQHLTAYMRNPTFLRLNISDPALLGINQYHRLVPYHPLVHKQFENKIKVVKEILSSVNFQQCLVFSNLQTRAQNTADNLTSLGWPTACIAGSHDQKDRNEAMSKLKTYKCRVLISTDLTARGIDADKVDLVINLDVPKDHETYLHRIGRAGRFGTFGAAITIISEGQEELDLQSVERKCNTHITILPDPIPADLPKSECKITLDDVVSTKQITTSPAQKETFFKKKRKMRKCKSKEVKNGSPEVESKKLLDVSKSDQDSTAVADSSEKIVFSMTSIENGDSVQDPLHQKSKQGGVDKKSKVSVEAAVDKLDKKMCELAIDDDRNEQTHSQIDTDNSNEQATCSKLSSNKDETALEEGYKPTIVSLSSSLTATQKQQDTRSLDTEKESQGVSSIDRKSVTPRLVLGSADLQLGIPSFSTSICYKPVKSPHTYASAKSEFEQYKSNHGKDFIDGDSTTHLKVMVNPSDLYHRNDITRKDTLRKISHMLRNPTVGIKSTLDVSTGSLQEGKSANHGEDVVLTDSCNTFVKKSLSPEQLTTEDTRKQITAGTLSSDGLYVGKDVSSNDQNLETKKIEGVEQITHNSMSQPKLFKATGSISNNISDSMDAEGEPSQSLIAVITNTVKQFMKDEKCGYDELKEKVLMFLKLSFEGRKKTERVNNKSKSEDESDLSETDLYQDSSSSGEESDDEETQDDDYVPQGDEEDFFQEVYRNQTEWDECLDHYEDDIGEFDENEDEINEAYLGYHGNYGYTPKFPTYYPQWNLQKHVHPTFSKTPYCYSDPAYSWYQYQYPMFNSGNSYSYMPWGYQQCSHDRNPQSQPQYLKTVMDNQREYIRQMLRKS